MGVSYKHEAKKEHLLDSGMKLLWNKGYHGTSVGDIVKVAGVPKGSFYNYFDSKEDFAIQAIEKYFQSVVPIAVEILEDPKLNAKEKVLKIYTYKVGMVMGEMDHKMGCIALNLGNEMSDHSEGIRKAIIEKESFMKNELSKLILQGQAAGEIKNKLSAEKMINFIEDAWKGATVTAKEYKTDAPLKNFLEVLKMAIL